MTTALQSLALFAALPALLGWIVTGIISNSKNRNSILAKMRKKGGSNIQDVGCWPVKGHKICDSGHLAREMLLK
jgi:hypothetical protein